MGRETRAEGQVQGDEVRYWRCNDSDILNCMFIYFKALERKI